MHPIAFTVAGYPVRYAGLMYVVAVVVAWAYAAGVSRRKQWDTDLVLPGVAVVVAAAYLGARIHGAMQGWEFVAVDPLGVLLRSNSLSFFGGLVLGGLALVGFLRWVKLPVGVVADELAPVAPVLYSIFRLGCFLNGDDYGVPTSLPWGVSFPDGSPPTSDPVHPVQLYEIGLMVPVWLALRRSSYSTLPHGARSFDLCVLMGVERFLIEFLRPAFANADYLAPPQWFALALMAIGVTGRLKLRRGQLRQ